MEYILSLSLAGGVILLAIAAAKIGTQKQIEIPSKPLNFTIVNDYLHRVGKMGGEYRDHQIELAVHYKRKQEFFGGREVQSIHITLDSGPTRELFSPSDQFTPTDLSHFLLPMLPNISLTGDLRIVGQQLIYEQEDLKTEAATLVPLLDFLVDLFEGYWAVVALGGELIPVIQEIDLSFSHPLQPIIPYLLRGIELSTTARLGQNPERFLCTRCWVRCAARTYKLTSLNQVRYYGCRACGQSQEVDLWPHDVVAVLDSKMTMAEMRYEEEIWVNWRPDVQSLISTGSSWSTPTMRTWNGLLCKSAMIPTRCGGQPTPRCFVPSPQRVICRPIPCDCWRGRLVGWSGKKIKSKEFLKNDRRPTHLPNQQPPPGQQRGRLSG